MSPGMQAGNDGRSSGNDGSPLGRVKSLGSGGRSLGNASQAKAVIERASRQAAIRRAGVIMGQAYRGSTPPACWATLRSHDE